MIKPSFAKYIDKFNIELENAFDMQSKHTCFHNFCQANYLLYCESIDEAEIEEFEYAKNFG